MNKYFRLLPIIVLFACNNAERKAAADKPAKDSLEIEDSFDINTAAVKSDDYYENFPDTFDSLIGCWSAIREGNITLTFSKDSTFEFYDYNSKLKEQELLKGKFQLEGSVLILFYDDRPKQRFTFKTDPQSDYQYRITNTSGYYFIKSPC